MINPQESAAGRPCKYGFPLGDTGKGFENWNRKMS